MRETFRKQNGQKTCSKKWEMAQKGEDDPENWQDDLIRLSLTKLQFCENNINICF